MSKVQFESADKYTRLLQHTWLFPMYNCTRDCVNFVYTASFTLKLNYSIDFKLFCSSRNESKKPNRILFYESLWLFSMNTQGLSQLWVRTVWDLYIWYHTVRTQNGLSPCGWSKLFTQSILYWTEFPPIRNDECKENGIINDSGDYEFTLLIIPKLAILIPVKLVRVIPI